MNSLQNVAFFVLRVVSGFLFTFHGLRKFGLLGGTAVNEFGLPMIAKYMEVIGGPLIMLGLLTPLVAFLLSGQMAVAYWMSHFPRGTWPIQNQGEAAALYCFIFLFFAAFGGGGWSVDSLLRNQRSERVTSS